MTMTFRRTVWIAGIVLLALVSPTKTAVAAVIVNPGFESPATASFGGPATDWTLSGAGGGVWNINDAPSGLWTSLAPEGEQVGWLSSAPAPGALASYEQILTETLQSGTLYTLSGYVGHPIGYGASNGTVYTVELRAGGNLLDSTSGTGLEGSFVSFGVAYESTGSAFIGQTLSIHLISSRAQTAFDAITLTSEVPEPATMAGLMVGALSLILPRHRSTRRV